MNLVECAIEKKVDETLEMVMFELNDEYTHNIIKNALIKKISQIFPNIGNKDVDIDVYTSDGYDLNVDFAIQDDNNFCQVRKRIRPGTMEDVEEGLGKETVIESF